MARSPKEKQEIIDAYKAGMETDEIYRAYKIGVGTLYALLKEYGVPLRQPQKANNGHSNGVAPKLPQATARAR